MNTLLQERFLTLADGRRVALLESPPAQGEQGDKPLLLALHGWLDNSASFVPLAPLFDLFSPRLCRSAGAWSLGSQEHALCLC